MKATEMLHILKTQNKRLFIVWLVTFIAFIGLLGYTIYLLNDIGVIEEFAREYPYGRYAVTMDGHITAIINGTIIDTFYPNRIMRCAWRID